jgi:hypothetical protein
MTETPDFFKRFASQTSLFLKVVDLDHLFVWMGRLSPQALDRTLPVPFQIFANQ